VLFQEVKPQFCSEPFPGQIMILRRVNKYAVQIEEYSFYVFDAKAEKINFSGNFLPPAA